MTCFLLVVGLHLPVATHPHVDNRRLNIMDDTRRQTQALHDAWPMGLHDYIYLREHILYQESPVLVLLEVERYGAFASAQHVKLQSSASA